MQWQQAGTQQGEMLKVDDLLIIPATFISVSFEKKKKTARSFVVRIR
jgi:Cft2 family RNA processing exonuclease